MKPFQFETFCLSHPDFKNIVNLAWENFTPPEGSIMFQFKHWLKNLKKKIKKWNHSTFSNIFQGQKMLEQSMVELQQKIIEGGRTKTLVNQEQDLLTQLE